MINKNFLAAALTTALISVASFAVADETANSPYVIVEGGYSKETGRTKGGYGNLVHKAKPRSSGVYDVGIGYKVGENVRSDITVNYRPSYNLKGSISEGTASESYKQKIKSLSVMLNAYYDFGNFNGFTPYVGAGIGLARNHVGKLTVYDKDTATGRDSVITQRARTKSSVAYQFTAGSYFKVADNVDLNIAYRFIDLGKYSTKHEGFDSQLNKNVLMNVAKGNLKNHEFIAGLKFSF